MAVIYRGVERGWTGSDRGGAGVVDLGCELGWVGGGGQLVWERKQSVWIGWSSYGWKIQSSSVT